MTLHVALIEPHLPTSAGKVAALCAGTDVPLHLIGPVGFALDDEALQHEGGDLWPHPDWFAFRDAISRDRCLYFTPDAKVDFTRAPFQKNSVLVFGNEKDGMPARILEKHRQRCYRLPKGVSALPDAVRTVLAEGMQKLGLGPVAALAAEPEEDEPNFNLAPPVAAPVPVVEEDEDEINYNVEQQPRPYANGAPVRGPRGGRQGTPGAGRQGGPGAPAGGRPRRGRGGRGRPKPKR